MRKALKPFLYYSPRRISSPDWLNLFGFQVLRTIFFNLIQSLKRLSSFQKKPSDLTSYIIKSLKEDGVVVLNNALDGKTFESILRNSLGVGYEVIRNSEVPVIEAGKIDLASKSDLQEMFGLNGHVTEAINHLSGGCWKIADLPSSYFRRESIKEKHQIGCPHFDGQDIPHYDVPFHSYKALLYLNSVDESNGAFKYSRGSHKLSVGRLIFEYMYSINYYHLKKLRRNIHPEITPRYLELIGGDPIKSYSGPANTLVIFDVMGIHARGTFSSLNPRNSVGFDYRMTDSFVNFIKNLSTLKS